MKIIYNINDTCTAEIEFENPKQLIERLSQVEEVMVDQECGMCGSKSLKFEHREHDGHSFYSRRCNQCGAQLDFGQHKQGETLFGKRSEGSRGWYQYHKRHQDESHGANENPRDTSGPPPNTERDNLLAELETYANKGIWNADRKRKILEHFRAPSMDNLSAAQLRKVIEKCAQAEKETVPF